MTIDEINKINTLCKQLKDIKLYGALEIYLSGFDNNELPPIEINKMVFNISQITKQFVSELQVNGIYLPITFQHHQGGHVNIINELKSLLNLLKNPDVNRISQLKRSMWYLINYQMLYNFWDQSKRKIHSYNEIKVKLLENDLQGFINKVENKLKDVEHAIQNMDSQAKQINDFTKIKKDELKYISDSVSAVKAHKNQIEDDLNESSENKYKIKELINEIEKLQGTAEDKINIQDAHFTNTNEKFKLFEKELEKNNLDILDQKKKADAFIDLIEGQQNFFEQRLLYLDNLIGREVGVSLFETFKQRKKQLNTFRIFWVFGIMLSSLVASGMVYFLFKNFNFNEPSIQVLMGKVIMNTLKTLPFFYLIYYSISQYNKERSYEEAYAFKSAVALTIKAYRDIIEDKDKKDTLVMESVSNIYRNPTDFNKKQKLPKNIIDIKSAEKMLSSILKLKN